MTRLFVGNIRYSADEGALRTLFEPFGPVREVYVGVDRETGRSRGFAFVTMVDKTGADRAVAGLNGKEVEGRVLVVNEAQPRGQASRGERPSPSGASAGAGGEQGNRGGFRGGAPAGATRDGRESRGAPYFRQPPYVGPPPADGGRPPKGAKPGHDRDRRADKERDKDKYERDDEW